MEHVMPCSGEWLKLEVSEQNVGTVEEEHYRQIVDKIQWVI